MQDVELFLCSQLMTVTTRGAVSAGNLEDIGAHRCTLAIETPPPVGAQVTLRCIECPLGKKSCTACRFKGRVRCHENDPVLGCLIQVEFEGRKWSREAWHPQHLTRIKRFTRAAGA